MTDKNSTARCVIAVRFAKGASEALVLQRMLCRIALATLLIMSAGVNARGTQGVVLISLSSCCEGSAWPEAENALSEELELLNIPVQTVMGTLVSPIEVQDVLIRAAKQADLDAAVMLFVTAGDPLYVEIWIYDRITDKTIVKRREIRSTTDPDAALLAGIQGVEALRASLLEIRMHPSENPSTEEASKPLSNLATTVKLYESGQKNARTVAPRSIVSEEIKRVAVSVGPSLVASFHGTGVYGGFNVAFDWQPIRFAALHFDAAYWPLGKDIVAYRAVSALNLLLLRGGVTFVISDKGIIRPAVSVLGGGFMAFADGIDAGEGRVATADVTKVAYIGGAFDAAVRVTKRFFLRIGVGVGITLPEIVLYHDDKEAASIGRPVLDASLRAEVRLP